MGLVVERVRLAFEVKNIVDVAVANNILYIAAAGESVICIDLDNPQKVDEMAVPAPKKDTSGGIRNIFVDPTGNHLLIVTSANEHYYLHKDAAKPRYLSKLHRVGTTCVSWDPSRPIRTPGRILLGTEDGTILETEIAASATEKYFQRDTKYLKTVWTAPERAGIAGIQVHPKCQDKIIVLAGSQLYIWHRIETDLRAVPLDYKATFSEAPNLHGVSQSTQLVGVSELLLSPDTKYLATLASGTVFVSPLKTNNDFTTAHEQEVEASSHVLLSKYHLLIVDPVSNRLSAVNIYDPTQTLEAPVPLHAGEVIQGVAADPKHETFWIYTAQSLLEITLEDESMGIWNILVKKELFNEALEVASSTVEKRLIYQAYGKHQMENNEYVAAASNYGKSNALIEPIALELLNLDQKEALVELFSTRLARTSTRSQQISLSSWVTEWLVQLGEFEHLRRFLRENLSVISPPVIYEILCSAGDDEELLFFAGLTKDYTFVINYWITNKRWSDALKVIRECEDEASVYQNATVLLKNCPVETVDTWMRMPKLNSENLLAALLEYVAAYRGAPKNNQAVRYLKHLTYSGQRVSSAVYNTLVAVLCLAGEEAPLMAFLKDKASDLEDLDYCLRMCLAHKNTQAAIYLYKLMSLYEEAVDLALAHELIDDAISIVETYVEDPQIRDILWTRIAQCVIASQGPEKALDLIGRVKTERLIELLPEFDTLGNFTPKIVKALQTSNDQLTAVSTDLEESLRATKEMEKEIASFGKRYVLVEPGEPCQTCRLPLPIRKFYVYPCQHGMHMDCVIADIEKGTDYPRKQRLHEAQSSAPDEKTAAIDSVLGSYCYLCSDAHIDSIDKPLSSE